MDKDIVFFYINLDSRKDRRVKMEAEFKRANVNIFRYSGIKHEKPFVGCLLSHLTIIKQAKLMNYEMVCIFEDDIYFHQPEKLIKYLKDAINQIPKKWSILYLGGTVTRYCMLTKINKNIYKSQGILSTHSIIYHTSSYQEILDAENYLVTHNVPIDRFLADTYQKRNPCFITSRLLASQRSDYSNIENKIVKNNYIQNRVSFFFYKHHFRWLFIFIGDILDYLGLSRASKKKSK